MLLREQITNDPSSIEELLENSIKHSDDHNVSYARQLGAATSTLFTYGYRTKRALETIEELIKSAKTDEERMNLSSLRSILA